MVWTNSSHFCKSSDYHLVDLCCLVMEERFVVVLFLNAVMAHQSLKVKLENGQAELVVG